MSIRQGQTCARWRSTSASASGDSVGASTAAIRASRIARSTTASPSGETGTPGGTPVINAAGTVALRSRMASRSGTVTKPAVTVNSRA